MPTFGQGKNKSSSTSLKSLTKVRSHHNLSKASLLQKTSSLESINEQGDLDHALSHKNFLSLGAKSSQGFSSNDKDLTFKQGLESRIGASNPNDGHFTSFFNIV